MKSSIANATVSAQHVNVPASALRAMQVGLGKLKRYWQIAAQRRRLAALDEGMLKDLGINPAQAHHETAKPFWQVPVEKR